MKSPFEDLQIDPSLVCEFFAVFSRFEYAMKATRYCGADRHQNAVPDWRGLQRDLGEPLAAATDESLQVAIAYLLAEPPWIQRVIDGRPDFQTSPLVGANAGVQALEAARRVRNNLFHGGKHTPHSPPERDARLIEAALMVLRTCLALSPDLDSEYDHQLV
jgi:hypothetical protein